MRRSPTSKSWLKREEFAAAIEAVKTEVAVLQEFRGEIRGKASQTALIGASVLSGLSLLIAIGSLLTK